MATALSVSDNGDSPPGGVAGGIVGTHGDDVGSCQQGHHGGPTGGAGGGAGIAVRSGPGNFGDRDIVARRAADGNGARVSGYDAGRRRQDSQAGRGGVGGPGAGARSTRTGPGSGSGSGSRPRAAAGPGAGPRAATAAGSSAAS